MRYPTPKPVGPTECSAIRQLSIIQENVLKVTQFDVLMTANQLGIKLQKQFVGSSKWMPFSLVKGDLYLPDKYIYRLKPQTKVEINHLNKLWCEGKSIWSFNYVRLCFIKLQERSKYAYLSSLYDFIEGRDKQSPPHYKYFG